MIRRGEIYLADLDPVRGHEQAVTRPVFIIQSDIGNQYSSTTIVAAITSRISKKRLPTHVEVSTQESGLPKDSVVLLEQIRTLDKERLIRKMGGLLSQKMKEVNWALHKSLDLE
jgi:mRNA interferase MazF